MPCFLPCPSQTIVAMAYISSGEYLNKVSATTISLLENTLLWNHNPEVGVTSARFFIEICSSDLWSLLIMKCLPKTYVQKHSAPKTQVSSSLSLWMWRWLDHHPGWVWLLVPSSMHGLWLALVSSCWSISVLCPHIPMIWICQMQLDT